MARKQLSERRAEKLNQLEALKAQFAEMEEKAAKCIGKLAIRAGLADINLDDADLLQELAAIASRFRNVAPKSQLAMARMRLYRADRTERRLGMEARKADTRNKIRLGGLILKAGLGREPASVLLGILLAAAKTLSGLDGGTTRERWRKAGEDAFAASNGRK